MLDGVERRIGSQITVRVAEAIHYAGDGHFPKTAYPNWDIWETQCTLKIARSYL